ncbi:MAG TPA: hypothetical protein VFT56_14015 [Sphingomonas sp.]|nr:hypothetical protein [Sphingomonas sp.]
MSGLARDVVVKVAGEAVTFSSLEALDAAANSQRTAIRSLEEKALARNPHDLDAWRRLEQRANDLANILTAMDKMIADEDVAVNAEIGAIRALIRQV